MKSKICGTRILPSNSVSTRRKTRYIGVARQVWEWSQIDEERQRKERRMDALES